MLGIYRKTCFTLPLRSPPSKSANAPSSLVSVQGLCHAYGDRTLLKRVSFTIHEGERVGLVGSNGAGKSTLAQILARTCEPDDGHIAARKLTKIAYLEQEPQFAPDTSARTIITSGLKDWSDAKRRYDEITFALDRSPHPSPAMLRAQATIVQEIESLGGWDQMHRIEQIADRLKVTNLDAPINHRSGGEQRRIALCQVLVMQPDLAILDEPTNHLDIATIEWLEHLLAHGYRGALLLITHDRYVLNRVVTRTMELDEGNLYSYPGAWDAYLSAKAARLGHQARTDSKRRNILRRELDWLHRSPQARTTKQKARTQRAEKLLDEAPHDHTSSLGKLSFDASRSGKTILELTNVDIHAGNTLLVKNLTLSLRTGERIGIMGPNGSGKTTLLQVLLGQHQPTRGKVRVGFHTEFAYFDQARAGLIDHLSILDNVAENRERVTVGGIEKDIRSYLSQFLFSKHKQRQKVSSLSGGERARVLLAKFLLTSANVLILDEPTNDLDVDTLAALEEMLVSTNATILFVTHDRYFLDRVATSVLSFENHGRVVRYEGYSQALGSLPLQSAKTTSPKKEPHASQKNRPASPKLTFTEKHELKQLMPLIEAAEAQVVHYEKILADPDIYVNRPDEISALTQKLEQAKQLVEKHIARWEELETKRSQSERE